MGQLINASGDIDQSEVERRVAMLVARERPLPGVDAIWHACCRRQVMERVQAEHNQWCRQRGLPVKEDAEAVMMDVSNWTDTFQRRV